MSFIRSMKDNTHGIEGENVFHKVDEGQNKWNGWCKCLS
jgi:hypothetical protein